MKATVELEDYLDAEVMDIKGKLAGSLRCFWTDEEDVPIFVGIKTTWGGVDETVVVPVDLAEADEYHSCVVIHASTEQLRGGPTLPCDKSLTDEVEKQSYQFFEITPPESRSRLQINKAAAKNKLHSS